MKKAWLEFATRGLKQEEYRKVKTITSHAGKFRWLQEVGDAVGWIPRPESIPSPYMYSPFWSVYRYNGELVVLAEVSHKRYVIYAVPPEAVGTGPQPY